MSQVGATPITAPGWTSKPKEGVAIVDCDVHHNFRHPEQLLPYLSKFYQEHLLDQGLHLGGYSNIPIRTNRTDLRDRMEKKDPTENKNSGGDPRDFNFTLEFLQEEHLDRWNIDYALLTGPPPFYGYSGLPDPDWAAALCRAFNDWTIEHWLGRDQTPWVKRPASRDSKQPAERVLPGAHQGPAQAGCTSRKNASRCIRCWRCCTRTRR